MEFPKVNKLYKYRDFSSRTLCMVANNELYFAVSQSFNDPFDCRARKEFEFKDDQDFIEKWTRLEASQQEISPEEAQKYVKEKLVSEQSKAEYLEEKSKMFQKLVLQCFGVCSFSQVPDDILMWSHYSNGHKGMCLEFNRSDENMLKNASPIEYPVDDEFPYFEYWPENSDETLEDVVTVILTKSKHWEYEKEWRLIQRPSNYDEPYRGHPVSYQDDMLSGIIFGSRMKNKEKTTIKNILRGKPVRYYDARLIKNKFQLEIVDAE